MRHHWDTFCTESFLTAWGGSIVHRVWLRWTLAACFLNFKKSAAATEEARRSLSQAWM
jgi:hypothetical protein